MLLENHGVLGGRDAIDLVLGDLDDVGVMGRVGPSGGEGEGSDGGFAVDGGPPSHRQREDGGGVGG